MASLIRGDCLRLALILLCCNPFLLSVLTQRNYATTELPTLDLPRSTPTMPPPTMPPPSGHLKPLHKAPGSVRVPDCYFVHIKVDVPEIRIHQLADELRSLDANASLPDFKASIMFVITKLGYGFSAKLSYQALCYVRKLDIAAYVEEDQYFFGGSPTMDLDNSPTPTTTSTTGDDNVSTAGRRVISWGLDVLDNSYEQDQLYHPPCNLTGRGVDVYVLDTGIQYSHAQFEGRALFPGCDIVDNSTDERNEGEDCHGHGTAIAALVGGRTFGVAPDTTIFSIRVLHCNRTALASFVVKGLECMLDHHSGSRKGRPAVVNLSLFGQKSKMLKRAVDKVIESGLSVVALSGNVETYKDARPELQVKDSCRVTPSSIHGVITVAGSTRLNEAYDLTKMGICVDLFAPGKDIVTAFNAGPFCPNCRITLSGSSFAAPHVTGAVALLLEKCPSLPPWRVKQLLLSEMTAANVLSMSTLRRRYRRVTPNLLLQLTNKMCHIQC